MNNRELSNEFDLKYNNIRSNQAPGIDEYEKSLFLTIAQEQVIYNYINPLGNKYKDGFEQSEKRRRDISQLVKNKLITSNNFKINNSSIFSKYQSYLVNLEDEVLFIEHERVKLNNTDIVDVLPITHDEFNLQIKNPFRKPKNDSIIKRVWRLDGDVDNDIIKYDNSVELILPSDNILTEYNIRYIKKPNPIILVNINENEFTGLGLTIEGKTEETQCELNTSIQRQIIDRAVLLAIENFEKDRIQTFPQVVNLNE